MSAEQDLELARRIVRAHLPPAVAEVRLFGSRARGDARRWSDIDIAVMPKSDLPAGLLAELREALEESNLLLDVDVIDLREAGETVREAVRREGMPWNESVAASVAQRALATLEEVVATEKPTLIERDAAIQRLRVHGRSLLESRASGFERTFRRRFGQSKPCDPRLRPKRCFDGNRSALRNGDDRRP